MVSFITIVKKLKPSTIRGQLVLGIAFVHLLLMTFFVFDMVSRQKRFLKKQNREQGINFVNDFAVNSTPYIIANDPDQLQRFTLYHTNFPHLRYAMILSADGVVLAHTNTAYVGKKPVDSISQQLTRLTAGKTLIENDHVLDIAVPILADNNIIGWARAGLGQDYIQTNLANIVEDGLLYIFLALLVGTACALLIGNRLTAGLYKLIATAGKIKEGDNTVRAAPSKTVELQQVATAFNQMLDEISINENLLRIVIESMPIGVWIFNENKEIVSINTAGKQIWSREKYGAGDEHELYQHKLYRGWDAETKKIIEPGQWAISRAIEKDETTINEKIEIETFDGKHKSILNSAIPLKGKEGKVIGGIVINVDVTELKKITEQLTLSETTFHSAFDYSAIGMALVSVEGKILQANKQLCKMLGYTESELLSLSYQDINHPDDLEIGFDARKDAVEGRADSFQMEKRYIHKNGTIIWANLSASVVRDSQSKPLFVVSQVENITERKKIIEQLARSESTLNNAFNYSAIGMGIVSPDGKFVKVNRELCRILGYSEEELLSLSFQTVTYPYKVEENQKYLEQILNGEISNFRMDKKYIHKNGTIVWANLSSSLVRDGQNKPLFFVSQIEDLTEKMKTSEQLTLSESTFRSAFDYSAIGIALVSPGGRFLEVNKSLCAILGYPEKELLSLTFQDITHADDLDEDLVYLKQTLDGEINSYRMEKRYLHKNGNIIWAHLGVSLVRDSQNQPLFFVSQVEDISARKKSEELIKESEEKFRQLVEETLVGVFILQNERFVYVNPQFEKISGYNETDLLNKMSYEELIHKDDLEKVKTNYSSGISADKRSDHYTFRAVRKDGAILHIEIIVSPISFDGKPANIGTIIDVTEKFEEEKRITKAVTDAQEKERQEISMELHDNVKQMMAATLLNIDFMTMIIKDDEHAAPVFNNIKNYIREAIEELRRISHQLAPSIDASISLEQKIKTVIGTMNVSESIEINYQFHKLEEPVKPDVQLAIYRIVQEQFTNILKHAKASLVDITVERRNGEICLSIEDNGVGFDTRKAKDGIGLENIKRRVLVLNGSFNIQTMPGDGCTLYVELPVN